MAGRTRTSPSTPWYLPEPPVMATAYGAELPGLISAWAGDLPAAQRVRGHALRFLALHRGDGADPTLVPDLGFALEQLGGGH